MNGNKIIARLAAAVTVVVAFAAAVGLSACEPGRGTPLLNPPASATVSISQRCLDCLVAYRFDEFECIAGGCYVDIERTCDICPRLVAHYSLLDLTAKAGKDYVGVDSGEVIFAAGAKTATVHVQAFPNASSSGKTFQLVLSVNGVEVGRTIGTLRAG